MLQMELIDSLARLADYAGCEADDESRSLLAEIQDEFGNLKRGAVREGRETDPRLVAGDVVGFANGIRPEFPKAAKGCQVFVSVWLSEQWQNAPGN
jgi:hypothetical protein